MHDITDLPAWERLFKKIVWKQLGDMEGKKILDFGSGEGITANHFAEKNDVTAIEPSKEMLSNAWKDYEYTQIVGDVNALSAFKNETFDMITSERDCGFGKAVQTTDSEDEQEVKDIASTIEPPMERVAQLLK